MSQTILITGASTGIGRAVTAGIGRFAAWTRC